MFSNFTGQLSKRDLIDEHNKSTGLNIIGFSEESLKPSSYDITPTIIAMSAKTGMLETVYRERNFPFRHYIYAKAKDTVLVISNEYICVPPNMAGYVVSRVSKVTEGFGHICTTIDPNWDGALIIALSNPTNKPLKIYVGKDSFGNEIKNPLATVTFHYLNTPVKKEEKNTTGMRLDLLEKEKYTNKTGIFAFLRKKILRRRRKYTDFFFSYCHHCPNGINRITWPKFVDEFSGNIISLDEKNEVIFKEKKKNSLKGNKHASEFVVTESILTRLKYWLDYHSKAISFLLTLLSIVIIIVLISVKIISLEDIEKTGNTIGITGKIYEFLKNLIM